MLIQNRLKIKIQMVGNKAIILDNTMIMMRSLHIFMVE